jgi:hypothetical protein
MKSNAETDSSQTINLGCNAIVLAIPIVVFVLRKILMDID